MSQNAPFNVCERSAVPSSEGVTVAGGHGADAVPAADRPVAAEDGVLVAVQLRLGHHEAGVVLRAAVLDTCTGERSAGVTGASLSY